MLVKLGENFKAGTGPTKCGSENSTRTSSWRRQHVQGVAPLVRAGSSRRTGLERVRQAGVCRAREAAGRGEQVDAARDRGHGEHAAGDDAAGAELVGVSVLVTEMVLAAVAYRAVEVSAGCYRLCLLAGEQCLGETACPTQPVSRPLPHSCCASRVSQHMTPGTWLPGATKGFGGGRRPETAQASTRAI